MIVTSRVLCHLGTEEILRPFLPDLLSVAKGTWDLVSQRPTKATLDSGAAARRGSCPAPAGGRPIAVTLESGLSLADPRSPDGSGARHRAEGTSPGSAG